MKIDHIGYLTRDMHKSIQWFNSTEGGNFSMISDIIEDCQAVGENGEKRNVSLCFLQNAQGYTIELVSPIQENSIVMGMLEKHGEGAYHICYQTDCLLDTIDRMKKEGWIVVKEPSMAIAFDNALVAFLYRMGIGLIELVEMS